MNLIHVTNKRKRGVSLVPLVDVVFILLLFFMLSSSFIQKREVPLDLPAITQVVTDTKIVELELLTNDGRVSVDGREFVAFDITAISGYDQNDRGPIIAIRSAQDVKMQALVTLLDRLTDIGLTKIALVE